MVPQPFQDTPWEFRAGESGWGRERSGASYLEDVGGRGALTGKCALLRLPVPLRGRAGSAAVPANRGPSADLRSASPGKESEPGQTVGPRGRTRRRRRRGSAGSWAEPELQTAGLPAQKAAEIGSGRSHGLVGGVRRCGLRGRGLGLRERRRGRWDGRGEGEGGACVCSGRGPPQRGSAGLESSARCCRGASTASLTAAALGPTTLAISRSLRGLHRGPSPVPLLGAHIRGAVRPAVAAEAPSGAHLEPPGRPPWSPRPPWPGRAGSPARSWSRTWSRGPGALSRAAGAW